MSLEILQRAYDTFQNGGEGGDGEEDFLDPDAHLHFIDAFEMPLWNWSTEKGTFERLVQSRRCQQKFLPTYPLDMVGI